VWDVRDTSTKVATPQAGLVMGAIMCLGVSHDGRCIVSRGNSLHIWDTQSGQLMLSLCPENQIPFNYFIPAEFSPDGTQIITVDRNGRLCAWEITGGRESWELSAAEGSECSTTFSPCGTTILYYLPGSALQTLDAQTGVLISELNRTHPTSSTIQQARYLPNGSIISAGIDSRLLKLWASLCGDNFYSPISYEFAKPNPSTFEISPDGS
ncbi:hypothetical protein FRC11_004341, partial [Ceratobasidium sp. 423]